MFLCGGGGGAVDVKQAAMFVDFFLFPAQALSIFYQYDVPVDLM